MLNLCSIVHFMISVKMDKSADGRPLNRSLTKNLRNILQCTAFCTVCLDINDDLLQLDNTLVKGNWAGDPLSLREMLEGIFGNANDILSDFICDPCKSSAASTYAFITKAKRTAQECSEYLIQLDKETAHLTSHMIDSEWKNAMILLELYNCVKTKENNPKKICKKLLHICELCGKGYHRKNNLIKHIKQHEMGTINTLNCPHCKSRPCMHERYLLAYNEQRLQKLEQITCIECNVVIGRTLPHLIAHVNREHLDIKANICEECGKSFYLECHYVKHFEYHHNNNHVCTSCFQRFRSENHLNRHMKTCENTIKSFKCSKCPVLSETKLLNQFHMATHMLGYSERHMKHSTNSKQVRKRKNRIYKCLTCNKVLKTKLELRVHIRRMHEKKPNLCIYCNKQFGSRKEYLEHVQTQEHRKNMPYNMFKHHCSHCDYAANTAIMLTAHINRIHLNIRPFECEYCQKCYFDKVQLKNHMKIHTGQKKLKVCDICGANLSGPTALKKHRRLHTGEKPYPCPYCNDKMNCASSLKSHIMRKHMEPTINCPLCELKFHTMNNARGHVKKTHWKSKEKFDYTKLKGLLPEDYEFFRDRRKAIM